MKEGYKLCPFCANEIKEGAIKCQYCKEYLNKEEENIEQENLEKESIEQGIFKEEENIEQENPNISVTTGKIKGKRNVIIGTIVAFCVIILCRIGYRQAVQNYANDLADRANNVNSYSDVYSVLSDLDMVDSEEGQKVLKMYDVNEKMRVLGEEYKRKSAEVGELYIYDLKDYKNVNVINDRLNNWKIYKKNTKDFYDGAKDLVKGTVGLEDDSEISSTLSQFEDLIKRADLNMDFLSYMKTIQNDFYIGSDGKIVFYDDAKYNEWYQRLVDFSNQSELYNKKYAKYLK